MAQILGKSLMVQGFIKTQFIDEQQGDFLREAARWFADGTLRHREHVVAGLENAPQALIDQLGGRNFGKVVVAVTEP